MPSVYPFDGDITEWLLAKSSPSSFTINPAGIPAGALVFIIENSSPETGVMVTAGLVYAPAPTCWEATAYDGRLDAVPAPRPQPTGETVPSPSGVPEVVPSPTG
jgi:hypothetical protein